MLLGNYFLHRRQRQNASTLHDPHLADGHTEVSSSSDIAVQYTTRAQLSLMCSHQHCLDTLIDTQLSAPSQQPHPLPPERNRFHTQSSGLTATDASKTRFRKFSSPQPFPSSRQRALRGVCMCSIERGLGTCLCPASSEPILNKKQTRLLNIAHQSGKAFRSLSTTHTAYWPICMSPSSALAKVPHTTVQANLFLPPLRVPTVPFEGYTLCDSSSLSLSQYSAAQCMHRCPLSSISLFISNLPFQDRRLCPPLHKNPQTCTLSPSCQVSSLR